MCRHAAHATIYCYTDVQACCSWSLRCAGCRVLAHTQMHRDTFTLLQACCACCHDLVNICAGMLCHVLMNTCAGMLQVLSCSAEKRKDCAFGISLMRSQVLYRAAHTVLSTCADMLQLLPHTVAHMCRHAAGGHSDEDAAPPSGPVRFPAVPGRPPGGRGGRSAQ